MYNPTTCYSRQRWTYPKDDDRNVVAAFFHLFTIILICTSLLYLNWFYILGSHCVSHLSTNQFFGFGGFYATTQNQFHLRNGGLITSPTGYIIHYNTSTECKQTSQLVVVSLTYSTMRQQVFENSISHYVKVESE